MAPRLREHDRSLKRKYIAKTSARREKFSAETRLAESLTRGGRNDLLRDCTIEIRLLSSLEPAERQTRVASTEQIERVVKSIKRFGFVGAILVRGNRIADGHVRAAACGKVGLEDIPCIDVNYLSEEEARLLSLSMNKISETGEWDLGELKLEMAELIALDMDLSVTGFSAQEQDIILLDGDSAESDEAEIPDVPEQPVSQLGDTFRAGDHRIHCGDARVKESYIAALTGRSACAIITDPPFNVKIANNVSGLGKHKHTEFVMASGEMSEAEFAEFLLSFLEVSADHLIEGGAVFTFIDWRSVERMIAAGKAAGLSLINLAVWDKGSGGMGAFLRSAHELIPIFCKGKSLAINNVHLGKHGRDRSNVFRYPGANKPGTSAAEALALHATPKNVDLIVDMILDVTHRGDVVLDPFLGSGTTIIAAQKTGRIACAIELDPKFVDVAIMRWEQLTGEEVIHEQTGMTFAELREARCAPPDAADE
jgi:DNA modification methylase